MSHPANSQLLFIDIARNCCQIDVGKNVSIGLVAQWYGIPKFILVSHLLIPISGRARDCSARTPNISRSRVRTTLAPETVSGL